MASQCPQKQSAGTAQPFVAAHGAALVGAPPPQSTSVSVPFLMPSELDGGAHLPSPPHERLTQSLPALQFLPSSHFGALVGAVPPQSTSLSVPFWSPSVALGGEHSPAMQLLFSQSVATPQVLPSMHRGATEPPQSTSLSSPSFEPFDAIEGTHAPSMQRAPAQVVSSVHFAPGTQPPSSQRPPPHVPSDVHGVPIGTVGAPPGEPGGGGASASSTLEVQAASIASETNPRARARVAKGRSFMFLGCVRWRCTMAV